MKVAMLAAGVGYRLGMGEDAPPKALLRFANRTLLERHLEILAYFGLIDTTLVVGHQARAIEREIAALGMAESVRTLFNPGYRKSSLLSLWTLRDVLTAGQPVLYMDADVLYDWRLLARLLESPHENCILIDRNVEPDDTELLDVRIRDGRIVAFGKGALVERLPAELRGIDRIASTPVTSATDVGAALRLGSALFPDDAQKRLVLLSDGNDTTGQGQAEAALAAARGIQVETKSIGLGATEEVLIERITAPSTSRLGEEIEVSKLIGATSRSGGGSQCAVAPSIYGDVTVFKSWIQGYTGALP